MKEAKQIESHPQWEISESEAENADNAEDSAVEDSDLIDDDDESEVTESDDDGLEAED